jgi:hypothetical protein
MDLRLLLNPIPDPDDSPRNNTVNNNDQPGTHSEPQQPTQPSSGYLYSRFFLSPRRLDPETASVSTNSSSKRRRTNRGGGKVEIRAAAAMGRSFSELEAPSDTSSIDDTQDIVKRGVAQLSLSGTSFQGSVLIKMITDN